MEQVQTKSSELEKTSIEEVLRPAIGPRKSPLAYGAGNFGSSILIETFGGFAYYYYVDVLGLALASGALIRTVFTIWDAIDDPLMGFFSDRTRSRWGRRHPWLMVGFPLMMLVFFCLFSVPTSFQVPARLFGYMLVVMLLYETLNTILGVNYSALYPELFRTLIERTRVAVFCQSGNALGLLVGLALSPLVFGALGFSRMAGIYALVGGTLFFLSLYFNREPPNDRPANRWLDFKAIIRGILMDRVFWLYILMMILTLFSTSIIPFALPFYVKYALQAPTWINSLLFGSALLASLATMPAWTRLMKRWKLRKVFLISSGVTGVGLAGLGLFPYLPSAIGFAIILGAAFQGINICNTVIRADLVSRNIRITDRNNEASYYGMMNSALRFGGFLQSLGMLLVSTLFGYVSGSNPGLQPGLAFRFLISVMPVTSLCLAAIVSQQFFKAFRLNADLPTSS